MPKAVKTVGPKRMCSRCEYQGLSDAYPVTNDAFYVCNLQFKLTGRILRTLERNVPYDCPFNDPFISSELDSILADGDDEI